MHSTMLGCLIDIKMEACTNAAAVFHVIESCNNMERLFCQLGTSSFAESCT